MSIQQRSFRSSRSRRTAEVSSGGTSYPTIDFWHRRPALPYTGPDRIQSESMPARMRSIAMVWLHTPRCEKNLQPQFQEPLS